MGKGAMERGAMNEELEQALRHCILCYLHFFVPLFFGKAHEREVERVRKHTHLHSQLVQKMGVSHPTKHELRAERKKMHFICRCRA